MGSCPLRFSLSTTLTKKIYRGLKNDDDERNHFYNCLEPFFGRFHGRSCSSGSRTGRRKWSRTYGVWTMPDFHDIIDDCTNVKDDELEKCFCLMSFMITMK